MNDIFIKISRKLYSCLLVGLLVLISNSYSNAQDIENTLSDYYNSSYKPDELNETSASRVNALFEYYSKQNSVEGKFDRNEYENFVYRANFSLEKLNKSGEIFYYKVVEKRNKYRKLLSYKKTNETNGYLVTEYSNTYAADEKTVLVHNYKNYYKGKKRSDTETTYDEQGNILRKLVKTYKKGVEEKRTNVLYEYDNKNRPIARKSLLANGSPSQITLFKYN